MKCVICDTPWTKADDQNNVRMWPGDSLEWYGHLDEDTRRLVTMCDRCYNFYNYNLGRDVYLTVAGLKHEIGKRRVLGSD